MLEQLEGALLEIDAVIVELEQLVRGTDALGGALPARRLAKGPRVEPSRSEMRKARARWRS